MRNDEQSEQPEQPEQQNDISQTTRGTDIVGYEDEYTRPKGEELCSNHRTTKRRGSVTAYSLDLATIPSLIAADFEEKEVGIHCTDNSTRRSSPRGRSESVTSFPLDSMVTGVMGITDEAKRVGGQQSPKRPLLLPPADSVRDHSSCDDQPTTTLTNNKQTRAARRRHSVTKYSLEQQQQHQQPSIIPPSTHDRGECVTDGEMERHVVLPTRATNSATHRKVRASSLGSLGGKKFDRRGSVTRYSLDGSTAMAVAAAMSLGTAVVAA